jgi:hypothetical protein
MKISLKKTSTILVLILSLFINGCNLFEAVDNSVNTTTGNDLILDGNERLAEADYATALNRFERALQKENSDKARRGRASAYAGLAGFNMFSILNSLQNSIEAPNSSAVVFNAAKNIVSLENLNKAIDDMSVLYEPTNDDLLFRALTASVSAAKTIILKYDTNLNSKLDTPDQINFTTNDNKTQSWEALYINLSSSSSPYSLERAYIELTKAFNGRGSSWETMSPFNSVTKSGTYTQANYNTIVAVGDFGLRIKDINLKFNNSVSEFKTAILALDGVN